MAGQPTANPTHGLKRSASILAVKDLRLPTNVCISVVGRPRACNPVSAARKMTESLQDHTRVQNLESENEVPRAGPQKLSHVDSNEAKFVTLDWGESSEQDCEEVEVTSR